MSEAHPGGTRDSGVNLQAVEFDPFAEAAEPSALQQLAVTSSQREVFAAVQMSRDAPAAFNLCNILRLKGPLDLVALREALRRVVERHAALRTCLSPDGQLQRIHAAVPVELPQVVLGDLNPDDAALALAELAEQEAGTALDLHSAPLWRARVLSWSDQEHALVFNAHHVISDGWSSSVLFADWARAYNAQLTGREPAWGEHLRYEDFVRQQLSLDTAAQEQADSAFWQARHTPPAAPHALPLDRPRPSLKTYACGDATLVLDAALTQGLRAMSARQGCTLFVTLLASFQALVARLTGQSDIVLGVPLALQTQLDNAQLIADGANTVPLRQTVEVDTPFVELMKTTRRNLLDSHEHARLSFGNLVHMLHLPRDLSRTPLVDLIFNLDRTVQVPDFGSARSLGLDSAKVFANSELTVDVVDDGQQLIVHMRYLKALFEAATLQRWLGSWRQALHSWVADPQLTPVQAFRPTGDEKALLDRFNATTRVFAGPQRLEALFAEQALRSPSAPALWCAGRTTSYAQLDAMANGVAHALVAEGVMPGDRVGLYCGRDEAMVAGVLGILKTGAAYVPLDPAFPDERLAYMVADAEVSRVLCDERGLSRAQWPGVSLLDLRNCPPRDQAPSLSLQADDPAYVIYTSGTTGRPKGVVLAHRSVCNLIRSVQMEPGMRPSDRHAAVATLSFDVSVMDLFLPLSVGACVIVIPREDLQDGEVLAARLLESAATSLQASPSLWRLLVDSGLRGGSQFRAFASGEPLPIDLARTLLERCSQLWNLYGPTETSIYSTISRTDDLTAGIRIGLPVANTQIHILDEQQRPVPFGAVGEICIGGDGLALGYLKRPELTAERFVPDPERPGHRMYRTGDLGRWHAEGGLECLGRTDSQIKLRGWRIEPAEIESCLVQLPGIQQALVQAFETTPGQWALSAYVVCAESAFDVMSVRDALRARLPEVMIPARLVRLDAMPLLPNGKIDRRALPDPLSIPPSEPRKPARPLSEVEQRVSTIWCELLGVRQVLPSDNFFDLGGHSLLAARAAQQMSQALGFKVDVPRLVMESLAQVVKPPQSGTPMPTGEQVASSRLASWLKRWTNPENLRRGGQRG
jgi:amino acid adenylation domain-containing protein